MSSTYVLTIPLKTEKFQEDILNKRLEIARQIYNASLKEIIKRDRLLKRDWRFRDAFKQKKKSDRNRMLRELDKQYGVSEYDLIKFTTPMGRHFKENLPSQVVQTIATRAYKAFDVVRFNKDAKKLNFKRKGEMRSFEGKSDAGIYSRKGFLKMKGLEIPVMLDENDEYQVIALEDRTKYSRILKKVIKGRDRFFVQMMQEGIPPKKRSHVAGEVDARVGIDIGTSTVAIVADFGAELLELAPEVEDIERERAVLLRKMDRQRRANNPDNYNPNGTIKFGPKSWINSNNYIKTRTQVNELYRKAATTRKHSHQRLANRILEYGLDIRVETMNFKGLQSRAKKTEISEKTGRFKRKKRFGKSIGNRAPAMLIQLIEQKLTYKGIDIKKVNTWELKASQYNHETGDYKKKALGTRWNTIYGERVQRDLYSAWLIANTNDDLATFDETRLFATYDDFKINHDIEMDRLKMLQEVEEKTLVKSIGV